MAFAAAATGVVPPGGEYPEQDVELSEDVRHLMRERGGRKKRRAATIGATADTMERKEKFTPPRQLTLNTKFQGAVMIGCQTDRADMSESTERQVRAAEGGISDIAKILSGRQDPAQLAVITAAVLAAMVDVAHPASTASSYPVSAGDPVADPA